MVIETQSLEFGTIIIRDFGSVSRFLVDESTGVTSGGPNTIILVDGQNAAYSLTGGPANTAYSIMLDATVAPTLGGGGGASFTLDRFRFAPLVLQTDGAGADTFTLGFRATSAGGGTVYADGAYDGSYDFTVQF